MEPPVISKDCRRTLPLSTQSKWSEMKIMARVHA